MEDPTLAGSSGPATADRALGERALALVERVTAALLVGGPIESLQGSAAHIAEGFGFTRCTVLAVGAADPQWTYVIADSEDVTVERLPLLRAKYPELEAA